MSGDWYLSVDFGTTNTVACVSSPGSEPRLLKLGNDWRLPSAVFWDKTGPVVGVNAIHSQRTDPTRFCRCPKREMGYDAVLLGGQRVPITDVVASVLAAVVAESAGQEGEAPRGAVVTYPVQWGTARRNVVKAAARTAGLTGAKLLQEPVAAAVRIGTLAKVPDGKPFAILDFGGGTTDVAVLERSDSSFKVLASHGEDPLGGEDLDDLLFGYVIEELKDRDVADLLANPPDDAWRGRQADVRDNCRMAKERLSEMGEAGVWVSQIGADVAVPRAVFESLASDILDRAVGSISHAVEQSDVEPRGLNLFFVGGSSRIPKLRSLVQERLGCRVTLRGDPQFVVTEGAALWIAEPSRHRRVPTIGATPRNGAPANAPKRTPKPPVPKKTPTPPVFKKTPTLPTAKKTTTPPVRIETTTPPLSPDGVGSGWVRYLIVIALVFILLFVFF